MRRHHSQVRNSSWTRFFDGVQCHQNRIGRSLPNAVYRQPVSIPQGSRSAEISFLATVTLVVFLPSIGISISFCPAEAFRGLLAFFLGALVSAAAPPTLLRSASIRS